MKDISDYILESSNKLSPAGKKKLINQVNLWINNINDFYKQIGTSKGQDHWDEVQAHVWNFLEDSGILSTECNDPNSISFINQEVNRLCDALDKLN